VLSVDVDGGPGDVEASVDQNQLEWAWGVHVPGLCSLRGQIHGFVVEG
jgi:hypothetical protein